MRRLHRGDVMDDYLWSLGFWRKPTAKDGSCLFRAVSEQIFHTQSQHYEVRLACIRFLERNKKKFEEFVEGPFDDHLYILRNPKEWAGQIEISALSLMYRRDFVIYQEVGQPPVHITQNDFNKKIYLCFSNGNHYDSVYPIAYLMSAGICQSIIYEVLYKDVFKMERPVEQGLDMMSYKSPRQRKDSITNSPDKIEGPTTPEIATNCIEGIQNTPIDLAKEALKSDRTEKRGDTQRTIPFPYRIAKALDPEIYRNVEYDAWLESKKEQQLKEAQELQDAQFSTGDKCQVTLAKHKDKVFYAHIQEICADKDLVTVFIEELGQKHTVPFESLKSLPQNHHHGWGINSGKSYRQLSGYYQKAQIIEDTNANNKKRTKKKKVPTATPR